MPKEFDANTLWVSINDYPAGNLFHVYPRLLADLLLQEEAERPEGDTTEAEKLILPSDKEWRLHNYFYLIELQNFTKESEESEGIEVGSLRQDSFEEWAPWNLVVPTKNPNAPAPVTVKNVPGPAWDIKQVLKAARLLFKPPMKVAFEDEHEMRHVYSVIYDVFRYKSILEQAIDDVDFFGEYPQYCKYRQTAWLFIMELARRRWAARPRGELDEINQLLEEAGPPFKEVENAVWEQRVHFAAAIARIRIKNKAFAISDLLPLHLREERMSACVNKETVTGWVNTFKSKKVASLVKSLHELGYSYSNSRQLCAGEYRFDRVCPRFITLRPPADASIGSTNLVKDGIIVLQEREFCEGASTLCRALRANSLQGVVAQTHASSPRSSAYLAAQLKELAAVIKAKTPTAPATPQLGKLVVFGAGDKVESYVCALRELGIEASEMPASGAPVCVLSDSVHCDTPTVTSALDGVVAALATPPNSYSSVTDPIDLVCGRGGDLSMLEILTETEIDQEGKARAQSILEEQKKTLRVLLSKPQIQLILYETHSALEAENQAQVTRAVAEANRLARERHLVLRKKPGDHRTSKTPKTIPEHPVDSQTSMDNTISRSDFGKDDDEIVDDISMDDKPSKSPDSVPVTAPRSIRSRSNSVTTIQDNVLKKRPDSESAVSKPGSAKARPIPEIPIPDEPLPQNPDNDSPNVYEGLGHALPRRSFLPSLSHCRGDGGGGEKLWRGARDKVTFGTIHARPTDGRYYRILGPYFELVPDCDLFEISKLPTLGNGLDINYILDRDGCYLGLIQRKEITHLDAKYMIKVAEERGLFAQAVPPATRRKREVTSSAPRRRRRKAAGFEVERVAAPTHASIVRSNCCRRGSAPANLLPSPPATDCVCERHLRRQAAASALTAAACTCDARHRFLPRRMSAVEPKAPDPVNSPPCRRPFPVAVHDVHFYTYR